MNTTIWGGVNLFSFILLMIGVFCLVIEMFTITPRIPAGVALVLIIIGIVKQANTAAQTIFMIAVICGIFTLLIYISMQTFKNNFITHTAVSYRKHTGNKTEHSPWLLVKAPRRRRYRV